MEFEYTDTFYVSETDLENMVSKVRIGWDVDEIIAEWACSLDDCDYYAIDHIKDQLKEEIMRRVKVWWEINKINLKST